MNYSWPGSVRELQNVVERMVSIATDGRIGLQHVPEEILCDSPEDVQPATFANIEDERRRMRWMLERRRDTGATSVVSPVNWVFHATRSTGESARPPREKAMGSF